ncbi:MAG: energy transducer TonB [Gemmatimonadetes bacterium]|nr:energy transducer TonB [Gemmatimonadota bacterium]MCY3944607.1 energy transducer TonB [Gemmatimonadota bacterium]
MSIQTLLSAAADDISANENFKRSSSVWLWGSISAATVVHFLIFAFWPSMFAPDVSFSVEETPIVDLPPEVEIPPPPEAIKRPATPVITDAVIEEDVTIAPVTFDDNPADQLPPPPDASGEGNSDMPFWAPRDVDPGYRDGRSEAALVACLEKHYPPLLRDAGIGGQVTVWAYVDETGEVVKTQPNKSSGHPAMDEVATEQVRVCPGAEFSPGMYGDRPVPLWVALPITFTPR